jgi:hypothetical protein
VREVAAYVALGGGHRWRGLCAIAAGAISRAGGAAGLTGISEGGAGVAGKSMSGAGLKGSSNAGHGLNVSSMQSYAIGTEEGGLLFKGISGVAKIPSGETQAKVDAQWVTDGSFLLISPRAKLESRRSRGSGATTASPSTSTRSAPTTPTWAGWSSITPRSPARGGHDRARLRPHDPSVI